MTDSIPDPPWSPAEKRFLLAELIKFGTSDPYHLLNIIRNNNIDIAPVDRVPLPPGRSFMQCFRMYNDMFGVQRNPSSHYTPPMQSQPPPHTPTPVSAPQQQYRPPYHPGPTSAIYPVNPAGRPIRPKTSTPVLTYGQSPSAPEPPPKRKRGRPTKAEAQAKADAAAVTGVDQPTPPRPASQATAAVLAPLQPARTVTPSTDEPRPMAAPATTRVSIAAILEPTTTNTTTPVKPDNSPSHGSSSSSKRRKARQRQLMDPDEASVGASADTRPDLSSPMPASRSREITPTRSPAVSTPAHGVPQSRPRSPPRPSAPSAPSALSTTPRSPPPPPTAPSRLPAPLQPRSPPPPGPSRP